MIGNKCNEFSLDNTSIQDQKEAEGQDGVSMEVLEVSVTDGANAMTVKKETVLNFASPT